MTIVSNYQKKNPFYDRIETTNIFVSTKTDIMRMMIFSMTKPTNILIYRLYNNVEYVYSDTTLSHIP